MLNDIVGTSFRLIWTVTANQNPSVELIMLLLTVPTSLMEYIIILGWKLHIKNIILPETELFSTDGLSLKFVLSLLMSSVMAVVDWYDSKMSLKDDNSHNRLLDPLVVFLLVSQQFTSVTGHKYPFHCWSVHYRSSVWMLSFLLGVGGQTSQKCPIHNEIKTFHRQERVRFDYLIRIVDD